MIWKGSVVVVVAVIVSAAHEKMKDVARMPIDKNIYSLGEEWVHLWINKLASRSVWPLIQRPIALQFRAQLKCCLTSIWVVLHHVFSFIFFFFHIVSSTIPPYSTAHTHMNSSNWSVLPAFYNAFQSVLLHKRSRGVNCYVFGIICSSINRMFGLFPFVILSRSRVIFILFYRMIFLSSIRKLNISFAFIAPTAVWVGLQQQIRHMNHFFFGFMNANHYHTLIQCALKCTNDEHLVSSIFTFDMEYGLLLIDWINAKHTEKKTTRRSGEEEIPVKY